MGSRYEDAEFQAVELRALGYDARVTVTPDASIVVRLSVAQAIFLQGCTVVANTRDARKPTPDPVHEDNLRRAAAGEFPALPDGGA